MAKGTVNSKSHITSLQVRRKAIQDSLAEIWAAVLRQPQIDWSANFFEIGGDSLKAMEVISRVREVLQVDLPLISFFENPTIEHLTDVLAGARTDVELALANIWAEALGKEHIDRDANFFEIGGDSLKAMEVIVRVSETLHVDLPLIAFFEDPTIKHLSAVIDELATGGTTPAITRVADRLEFPLSHSQQVFWLLEQQNPETGIYNKPRVFRIHGHVDPAVMERSLNELRWRHEILRVRFVSGVDGPVQIVDESQGGLEFVYTDLSDLEPIAREITAMKLALETVRKPLDIANGQIQRSRLVRFSDDEFLLCISEHHVVNDGFTGSILLDELGAVYDAFASGKPNSLPPLELHYTDYAVWEQRWMQGKRLADEMAYWREVVETAPKSLDIPTDFAPTGEVDRRGGLRSRMVSPELFQRIRSFAQTNGTTQFTVMSAALRLLLYRWSGQSDFLLGTTASNRSRSGTERMPGPFVNPLPLRNPVEDRQTVAELLSREKLAVMEAFAHQDCPFAKIVEAVNPERTTEDNPLFNVGLVMENFPEIELKGRYFETEYLNFDPEVSLLDLRFSAVEKDGGLRLSCEYKSAVFLAETVDALLHAYEEVLATMIKDAQTPVREFCLPDALAEQAQRSAVVRGYRVAITASYTAEPILEPLEFWLRQLGMSRNVDFAPFNQVFQQLLDPSSLLAANQNGANVVLIRVEDLQQTDNSDLTASVNKFLDALRGAAKRNSAGLILVIGPASESAQSQPERAQAIYAAEEKLVAGAREIAGVHVISSADSNRLYPVSDYSDEYNYSISHIPYKPAMFVALASAVARQIYDARRAVADLIILDVDAILNSPAAQEFMLAQGSAGVILALCGSQSEAELSDRFNRSGARLGWQDLATSRFDVRVPSKAVKEIAEETGLRLETCLFVTTDAITAAEVSANSPSLLVAQLPSDIQAIPHFLEHFWGFDHLALNEKQPTLKLGSELLNKIANELSTVGAITQGIEAAKVMRRSTQGEPVAPRTPEEEFLADVWSRLLRVENPGIHDNFFALGGHSLMAAQVVARVRHTLGVEMPLRAMFDAPTIALFAERIELERRAQAGMLLPPIARVAREGRLPLSYSQQRLWFIDQLEPDSPLYNISAMYRMRGELNVEALSRTVNEIVRRHESLRTTFHNVDGHPVAVISPEVGISLSPVPVAGSDERSRELELGRLALAEATTPFDLAKGPLIRARLLRVSPKDHVLLIIVHHIVGDGWSGSLIAGELAALYEAFSYDRPSPLPELAIQYTDFAVWQREWLQGETLSRQVDYWRAQLDGAPALLELPTDRPRPAVQSHRGDVRTHIIPNDLIERLSVLSQGESATLFMTLLAGFQVLLSRYSGQEDIVVGSTIAGRNYAEIEPLIGFFVNTLALRTDLSGNPTFRDLLARVKQVALEGYAHQELPFEKLVEELQPQRSLSYNPIFQVLFGLQNMPRRYFEASGLSVERSSVHQSTSILDMSWFAFPVPQGLLLRVEYDTDLFDATTINRMIGHYQNLLDGIAAHPVSRIADLPLLSKAEEHKNLVEFNQTAANYPKEDLLHDFVTRQAAATPDSVALIVGETRVSYHELNTRANQVANYLIERGAGPEVLVGIYATRSVEMLIGILGILKSGSAYVPLDPDYPKERIRNILEDAKAPIVVTQNVVAGDLLEWQGERICLDRPWSTISRQPETDPQRTATPNNLAYVLFTSGSTGRPKGVAIEHRSAATFVHWACNAFKPEEVAGVLFSTSMCFDLSVFEMFAPLSMGGCVILAENILSLPTLPAKNEVTLINTVPSAINELVRMGGVPVSVKTVNLAGEALTEALVEQIYANTKVEGVYNLYGPTEDTTYSTYTLVPRGKAVTVGRPIANSQAYILDHHLHPVPIGVPGELYLAGEGLARGYYGRPDLTAERFVANPFSNDPDARMYRTGDLCRYRPDGSIDYVGRIDHQIKLRGFRIELGEIEAVLLGHSNVRQCVVVARENVPGDKRLVAYVVPKNSVEEHGELIAQLKDRIGEKLPEFMMPSAFVLLEAMPLSPNGKVNRAALPAPEFTRGETEVFVAPRNAVEQKLVEIWSEVLRLPQVSVRDNFFHLGGHSLLATQVVSRVRQWAHVELPLRAIFEAPTIAELAQRVETLQVAVDTLPPVRRALRDRALPLSSAQQRLWFLNQLDPNSPLYNVPQAMRMTGTLNLEAMEWALNQIVQRHEVLRTSYQIQGDKPVQVIAPEVRIEVPLVDLGRLPPDQQEPAVKRAAVEMAQRPFNLQTGPLIRATMFRLGPEQHVLLLVTHHIANDGWSIWQFANELAPLYESFLQEKPSTLRELLVQYADFSVWQEQWLRSETIARQLEYWKQQLDGAPKTLELPTDRRRPAVLSSRGAVERAILSRELNDRLNALSRREGTTLFMTLLAAYATLLYRYTGQEDIVVGSPVANRNRAEIEDLIGFFVNTLVMRTDVSGNPTFLELLRRVRVTALGAYDNQDLPFERLVEALQPERELNRNPLFQVMFVLQNAPLTTFRLPGLEITGMDAHNGTSKFDMATFMVEKPEGLLCSVEYSTELFDASTIRRMLGHYGSLLQAAVANPDKPISELPMLSQSERQQILVGWNDTETHYPSRQCMHELFAERVRSNPERVAVICGEQQLTYSELHQQSNQLARFLQKLSVGRETLVALMLERSTTMMVALLGIMKAGGAYLPLDSTYPPHRLEFILKDSGAAMLLTQQNLADLLTMSSVERICLDTVWASVAEESGDELPNLASPKNRVYVLYTSGSTGKPKGVEIEHRNLTNFLTSMQKEPGLHAYDTLLAVTTVSFDIAGLELYLPLISGAQIVLATPEQAASGKDLHYLLTNSKATVMQATPVTWRMLLEAGWKGDAGMKVLCGGEALPTDLANKLRPRCAELWNMYGPTETTIWSSVYKVDQELAQIAPIGRPIANTTMYVLAANQQPVPVGVRGDLYIGGAGVARGYLNRPELTSERFLPDPFRTGERMYRTGDVAYFLPDGNIQFQGRSDFQIKLRGFRIELGEIETALDSHPNVRQSVVVAREDTPGDKRLVAYVLPNLDTRGLDDGVPDENLSNEQVLQWAEAWNEAYRDSGIVKEATFNIKGWNSSYTGLPIPSAEMRAWVEATVERILALHPRRVWEIGCGTGLLLLRVAPLTERYRGTDISQTALSFLEQQLQRPELQLPQVTVERRAAHEFDREAMKGQFDAVVLNSVVQYFPDLDYLLTALDAAINAVHPGGAVFVGDLRSLPLLETFHASVELFKADDAMTRGEILQRVQKGIRQEGELLIDPEFFTTLCHRWPQIAHVEMQLKRGRAHNELTRFRYDVVLHIGHQAPPRVECAWLDWRKQGLTRESLLKLLQKTQPEMLGVSRIPNARLRVEAAAMTWLTTEDSAMKVGEFRRQIAETTMPAAIEPEDLWALEREVPYQLEIRASKLAVDGCCDVVLRRRNAHGEVADYTLASFPGETEAVRPWSTYANNPLRQRVAGKLVPQLRLHVGAKLPEYMVPSAFVLLDAMPLTNNGKINRRALPAPEQTRSEDFGDYSATQTPVEELVAAIFADILRIERVGRDDNFFEMGGHSLSATQVVSRIRQNLRVDMPVRTMFEAPTVASLAQAVEAKQRSEQGLVAPPLERASRDQRLPLSFAQQRLWVLDQIEPNNALYNIPRPLRLTGKLNVEALEMAINSIVARHEVLRTNYGSDKVQAFQVIADPRPQPLRVIDLSHLTGSEVHTEARRVVENEAATPFDLVKDPIIRYVLIRLSEEDHIFMVTTHHIADDGWSTGILLRELTELYEAGLNGKPSPLAPLEVQYADYAVWQRNWLRDEVLDQQVTYWRKQLDGAPPVLQIPSDRARSAKPTFRGAMHRFVLPASLLESVRALSRQQGSTAFMTLLAAFQTLILHITKQTDVVLGTDLANRTTVQTEVLIGFFVNLLAVRTNLSGDPTFTELLSRVRDVALAGYAHQDVPFDKLVEELQPERSSSHNPIVQVLFVQQNTPRSSKPLPGLSLSWFPIDVPSKFDMAVFISETDDGVVGNWVYSSDLFDASTIARMAGLYQLVLEKTVSNPAARLSELVAVLEEEDQKQLALQHKEFQQAGSQKLKTAKRKAMNQS